MREEIEKLLHECLDHASEDDLIAIKQLLTGVKDKLHSDHSAYISSILQMKKTIDNNKCTITMPINKLTDNSAQMVHGGITATLLDTAMGTIANQGLPEGYGAVTSNLHIHYIAPGIGDSIRAEATVIHRGTQTVVIESSAYRSDNIKIAHCTSTFHIVKRA